jgi:ribosomal protein S6
MFLLDAADATQDWEGLKQHVTDLISRCGGEILYTERWPDRKLAYEIKGRRKGTYLLTYFRAPGEAVKPLRREARLSEQVLRVLILENTRALQEIEKRKEAQEKVRVRAAEAASAGGAPPAGDETPEEFGNEEAVLDRDAGKDQDEKQAGEDEKQAGEDEKQAGEDEKQAGEDEKQAGEDEKQAGEDEKQAPAAADAAEGPEEQVGERGGSA